MSAQEIIAEFKELPPAERAQVVQFVVENKTPLIVGKKTTIAVAEDGLPIIRANGGVITSRLVQEIESLSP
ncbi:MAG: hypothetical protein ABIR24_11940 [Verrucomicrobiota bacterium]